MQFRPGRRVRERIADRASAPREASAGAAIDSRIDSQPGTASFRVEAAAVERTDRTGARAGSSGARIAGSRPHRMVRERDRLRECDRAATGVPETEFRVNEEADRRRPDRGRASRPGEERQVRRTVAGKMRNAVELSGDGPDHPAAPPVERIGASVAAFGRRLEPAPQLRIRPGRQNHRTRAGRHGVFRAGLEAGCAEAVFRQPQPHRLERPVQRIRFRNGSARDQPSRVGRASWHSLRPIAIVVWPSLG